jgi:osmoprotectant transport system permease protein
VATGDGDGVSVSPSTYAFLDAFRDAFDLIINQRESVSGGTQIGGIGQFWEFTRRHLVLSGVATIAAIAVAMPIGLFLGHKGRGEFVAITVSNIGRAVPALALLGFFLAYLGIGFTNVAVVLFLLAVPPILTNTFVGVRQVDRDAVDSARGMGMTEAQIVRQIELPLALPTIFAGIRLAAVAVLATATIAPLADVQTLGEPIITPVIYGGTGQLAASILVALITLAADWGIGRLQRVVTPKGLKVAQAAASGRRRRIPLALPTRKEKTA